MTIINKVIHHRVDLNQASQNPFLVTTRGAIEVAGTAVVAEKLPGDTTWTITNAGLIRNTDSKNLSAAAIQLRGNADVTNRLDARISGGEGIDVIAQARIQNSGAIIGSSGAGIFVDSGNGSAGAMIDNGLYDPADAEIQGATFGIISFAKPTVINNDGSIKGGRMGVDLNAGGEIVNGKDAPTALISGGIAGIYAAGAATTHIDNSGAISGVQDGIQADPNVVLLNGGSIMSTAADGYGAFLDGGGIVLNQSNALIQGGAAGLAVSVSAYIKNYGIIRGTSGDGVSMHGPNLLINETGALIAGGSFGVHAAAASASLTNYGTVQGDTGVAMLAGGTLINGAASGATALIDGKSFSVYDHGAAIVTNWGSLIGAVRLGDGDSEVVNHGSIAGNVTFSGAGGTIDNTGTINGNVSFDSNSPNLLIDHPDSVFTGMVNGGSPGSLSTLELAAGEGTISGIGEQFKNFDAIFVDKGAVWSLGGVTGLAAGQTLTNQGAATLLSGITGFGDIINDGDLIIGPGSVSTVSLDVLDNNQQVQVGANSMLDLDAVVTGTGGLDLSTNTELAFSGVTTAEQHLQFSGSDSVVDLLNPLDFQATINGFLPGDKFDLVGIRTAKAVFLGPNNLLTISGGRGGPVKLQLDRSMNYSGFQFEISSDGRSGALAGTDLTIMPRDAAAGMPAEDLAPSFLTGAVSLQDQFIATEFSQTGINAQEPAWARMPTDGFLGRRTSIIAQQAFHAGHDYWAGHAF